MTHRTPQPAFIPESVGAELLKEVLARFGRARLRVWGTSMMPAIWPGELLEVVRADAATFCPGDIALFEQDGRLVCHRVETVTSAGTLHTRGDHLCAGDPPVPASAVLGRIGTPARKKPLLGAILRSITVLSERPLAWLLQATARS